MKPPSESSNLWVVLGTPDTGAYLGPPGKASLKMCYLSWDLGWRSHSSWVSGPGQKLFSYLQDGGISVKACRKPMAHSNWVIGESFKKGLYTKAWSGFKETNQGKYSTLGLATVGKWTTHRLERLVGGSGYQHPEKVAIWRDWPEPESVVS